ncbi:hypothetical protein A5844_002403 [Enterococcus sp. 10A9_DIV0425]|uniref:Uncharacterized protein n=1 Tax=Candidatus Enterococcus wittei TaxID=1987383 RepID=A0A242JY49_9ENTE|nr:hypothetical protein [Enterococcus sp. 10A9_DIV0425]OTP09623.1 hypothetical protein A5844_002403 [Enterococcus sp. 10A9_DIV0425]THE15239.1 hypothetical protein E1H99_03560 [Enterococcus hirae]
MELLEKESLALLRGGEELVPYYVIYVFFKESEYQGMDSHRKAILMQLDYFNRIMKCNRWASECYKKTGNHTTDEKYEEQFTSINADPIIYTDIDPDSIGWEFFPIHVNQAMMEATPVDPQTMFQDQGVYKQAFFDEFQVTKLKKADFEALNEQFFPEKENLIIYSWNTEFTNYYNEARWTLGAYLWSVYDTKSQRLTVINICSIAQ